MFKLKFPSGSVLKLGIGDTIPDEVYQGTLYIWPEDLEPLLEIVQQEFYTKKEKEKNDNPMPRKKHDIDTSGSDR